MDLYLHKKNMAPAAKAAAKPLLRKRASRASGDQLLLVTTTT